MTGSLGYSRTRIRWLVVRHQFLVHECLPPRDPSYGRRPSDIALQRWGCCCLLFELSMLNGQSVCVQCLVELPVPRMMCAADSVKAWARESNFDKMEGEREEICSCVNPTVAR